MDKKLNIFILAAGSGSRMGKLGVEKPKSLISINKKIILLEIIKKLNKIEVNKKIFFVIGFKYKKILEELKKLNLNFKYVINKQYNTTGSAYSWYLLKKFLPKNKFDTLLIHADLNFHFSHLKKIIDSKKENIIGSVKKNNITVRKKGWVLETKKNLKITKLRFKNKNKKYYGEMTCINKFSYSGMQKIFKFMKSYFKNNGRNFTWEILLNEMIKKKSIEVYSNKVNKNYWFNINKQIDLKKAKKFI